MSNDVLGPELTWFTQWRSATGEGPPNFSTMRSSPDLPDLMRFADGREVRSDADWAARCDEIRGLLTHWFFGEAPTAPTPLIRHRILTQERHNGVVRREIELTFQAGAGEVLFPIETMTPDGRGPYPVFLSQTTHRPWAIPAVLRGMACCLYPACDVDDRSLAFADAFPAADWTTIARRAWLASRVIDYLQRDDHFDDRRIGLTGHSRNGKQSMIAAAMDPRIAAVISSSSGAAGAAPYRFMDELAMEESVEFTTRLCPDWFHPRLRFFIGREDKMPIDIHGLLALVAPRPCLLATALNDGVETTFAVERSYQAGKEAYRFLDAGNALQLTYRDGGHEVTTETLNGYLDWFEVALNDGDDGGRERGDLGSSNDQLLHGFDWSSWRAGPGKGDEAPTAVSRSHASVRDLVTWSLGGHPPIGREWGSTYGRETSHDATLMRRSQQPDGVVRKPVHFSDYVAGDLYYPADATEPLPVVFWLHGYSYSSGYVGAYMRGEAVYHRLVREGFAVMAWDQLGFGRRIREGAAFYRRYPHWSKLAKMIRDVCGALDFLTGVNGNFEYPVREGFIPDLPRLNLQQTYLLGYGLGGLVGLYSAALDERFTGLASFSGFTPMRSDHDQATTGGIRRLYEWHGLQPRLGLLRDDPSKAPFDYDDLLRMIAPRPTLIVAPEHDRHADAAAVAVCVENAKSAWSGGRDALTFQAPDDYSRFQSEQHDVAVAWLRDQVRAD